MYLKKLKIKKLEEFIYPLPKVTVTIVANILTQLHQNYQQSIAI